MNARNQRVIQMAKELTPPREIARIEGVTPATVHGILAYARRRGEDVPKFANRAPATRIEVERPKNIVIGLRLHRLLEFAAEQRGMNPNELARDLLEAALLRKAAQDA